MRDFIEDAIKGKDADYLEIRVEESQASHIRYQGKELDDLLTSDKKLLLSILTYVVVVIVLIYFIPPNIFK